MQKKVITTLGAFLVAAACANADTFTTDTGVTFDGVMTETPEGLYKINAGGNDLIFQKHEIVSIEKNEKTGKLDLEAVAAEAKKKDEQLTAEFGLDQAQRARIEALLVDLMQDDAKRVKARDSLLAMAAEVDIYKYFEFRYIESTPFLQVQMLDVLYRLRPELGLERLREAVSNNFPGVRERAIELLAQAGDTSSAELLARGLVDPEFGVRISASYAMANLKFRPATPALIASLTHPDLRVSNAAKESLTTLWQEVLGDKRPTSVDEWNAVWDANKGGVKALALDDLEPLADPEVPFVNG